MNRLACPKTQRCLLPDVGRLSMPLHQLDHLHTSATLSPAASGSRMGSSCSRLYHHQHHSPHQFSSPASHKSIAIRPPGLHPLPVISNTDSMCPVICAATHPGRPGSMTPMTSASLNVKNLKGSMPAPADGSTTSLHDIQTHGTLWDADRESRARRLRVSD